jgi:hypothetical protein
MNYRKLMVVFPVFAALLLLIGGCVPMQMTEESSVLYDKGITLKQTIQEKDSELNKLKELLSDQQRQLRELNDRLNECRAKK